MAVQEWTFEDGTDGAAATPATTGLTAVTGPVTFAAAMAAHGSLGVACSPDTDYAYVQETVDPVDAFSLSAVLTVPTEFPAAGVNWKLISFETANGTFLRIQMSSDHRLSLAFPDESGQGFANVDSGHYVLGGQYRFSLWGSGSGGNGSVRMYTMQGSPAGNARDLTATPWGQVTGFSVGFTESGDPAAGQVVGLDDLRFEAGRTTELPGVTDPVGAGTFIFDGADEIPVDVSVFDGTAEIPADLTVL